MKFTIRKIYPIVITIIGLVLVSACKKEDTEVQDRMEQEQRYFNLYVGANYPNVTPRSNGLYYLENKAGTGALPDTNDWVLVNHVCYKIPTNSIYESYIKNVVEDNRLDPDTVAMYGPYKMLNGSRNAGLTEGLSLMKEGGQATIFFTSELGYGVNGTGKISGYQSLKYEIELLEVIPDMDQYELDRIATYMDTVPLYDTIHDPGSDAIMYYIIDHATNGSPIAKDSLIDLAYKGYLMDGRVFDERTGSNPYSFKMGSTEFISGWDFGLLKLKEGEKARFIIPYQMAYGEAGRKISGLTAIPPYETLLFDIEVLSVEESPGNTSDQEK